MKSCNFFQLSVCRMSSRTIGVSSGTVDRLDVARVKIFPHQDADRFGQTPRGARLHLGHGVDRGQDAILENGLGIENEQLVSTGSEGKRTGSLPRSRTRTDEFWGKIRLFSPLPPGRRSGEIIRRDFVRGAEVDLGETAQTLRSFSLYDPAGGFLDRGRDPPA